MGKCPLAIDHGKILVFSHPSAIPVDSLTRDLRFKCRGRDISVETLRVQKQGQSYPVPVIAMLAQETCCLIIILDTQAVGNFVSWPSDCIYDHLGNTHTCAVQCISQVMPLQSHLSTTHSISGCRILFGSDIWRSRSNRCAMHHAMDLVTSVSTCLLRYISADLISCSSLARSPPSHSFLSKV